MPNRKIQNISSAYRKPHTRLQHRIALTGGMSYSEPVHTAAETRRYLGASASGEPLTLWPITATEHLAFVRSQRSASFLQTPAWGQVKTEWRSESLGWFDGGQLVGARLVLHRPVPRFEWFTLAYLPEGPVIDWSGDLGVWLDPLAAHLKAQGAFAIRLGPPVGTDTWSADQVKEGVADPGRKRLTDVPVQWSDPVGTKMAGQLTGTRAGCRRTLRTASGSGIRSSSTSFRWPAGPRTSCSGA
jgi:hypothetical protein